MPVPLEFAANAAFEVGEPWGRTASPSGPLAKAFWGRSGSSAWMNSPAATHDRSRSERDSTELVEVSQTILFQARTGSPSVVATKRKRRPPR